MNGLKPPGELVLDENKATTWRKYKQTWENYRLASGLYNKPEMVQVATFLHVIGEDAVTIFNSMPFAREADKSVLDKILEQFDAYCVGERNVTIERHKFNTKNQEEGESIDEFVTALRTLAATSDYGTLRDQLIKDRIVSGVKDTGVREKLFQNSKVSLKEAIDIAKAVEMSKVAASTVAGAVTDSKDSKVQVVQEVDQVQRKKGAWPKTNSQGKGTKSEEFNRRFRKNETPHESEGSPCSKCGYYHKYGRCPAYGKICANCKGRNHFASVCKRSNRNVTVNAAELEDSFDEFYINSVHAEGHESELWSVNLPVVSPLKTVMVCKIDTGAQVNVMSQKMCQRLRLKVRMPKDCRTRLRAFNGAISVPIGETSITALVRGIRHRVNFLVVESQTDTLLGGSDSAKLGLIARVARVQTQDDILDGYKDVFTGMGCLPGEYKIEIDPTVTPVVHSPRRVPVALQPKLRAELTKMEQNGIIRAVPDNEASDWVSSVVIVTKPNGQIRVCLDPRDLNKAIKREHHPMINVEDIAARVGQDGAKIFSTLDAEKAFFQIKLTEDSSKLLTFNTPFGRFHYLRMPMGINSAPEKYQRRMKEILLGMPGVEVMMDDILVWGSNQKEHDDRLHAVLQRVREIGLKLNRTKCHIGQDQVVYQGHIFAASGLKVDPEKVRAVRDMPEPEDKLGVQRFLGMLNYVSRFIPHMSTMAEPLRELIKKDTEFLWQPHHQEAFDALKEALIQAPVLAYYRPDEKLILQVDSSSKGVGAALIQNGQPVAYASKALTPAQQNWAQIEKELHAIVYGCEKFYHFVIGRETLVQTDHRPLEAILVKPLYRAPARLQRMMIQLQRFPNIAVQYFKGSEHHIADTLSRAYLNETKTEEPCLRVEAVQTSIEALPMSQSRIMKIRQATQQDPVLQQVQGYILKGWPEVKKDVETEAAFYWSDRDEMAVINGVIFKGQKIVTPSVMRSEILQILHQAHLGIVKTKQRAKEFLYWPGLGRDIETLIGTCSMCLQYARSNAKEPLISHEVLKVPWTKLAADIFHFGHSDYLICVDYFSRYPVVEKLGGQSTRLVIEAFKKIFSTHGIPSELGSDNGPCFASREFRDFARSWDIKHTSSSPKYPRSNSLAERYVQIAKSLMKKSQDFWLALLEDRNTPLAEIGVSPAQLLMSRRLRSNMPMSESLLLPQPSVPRQISDAMKLAKAKQQYYHDRIAVPQRVFQEGDNARVQLDERNKEWTPAKVHRQLPYRSYEVVTPSGRIYRRNSRHLRYSRERSFVHQGEPVDLPEREQVQDVPVRTQQDVPVLAQPVPVHVPPEPVRTPAEPVRSRSGREIKPPDRLNL